MGLIATAAIFLAPVLGGSHMVSQEIEMSESTVGWSQGFQIVILCKVSMHCCHIGTYLCKWYVKCTFLSNTLFYGIFLHTK